MEIPSRQKLAITSLAVIVVAFVAFVGLTVSRRNHLIPTYRPGAIVVHVAGAVKSPGVFEMAKGARLSEAIERAGGLTRDADAARINQAQTVKDGTKIRIPRLGDPEEIQAFVSSPASEMTSNGGTSSAGRSKKEAPAYGSISLNSASIEQLMELPRIGKSTAQKIVQYRMQIGGFRAIEDLDRVKGIGPKTLELIRPYVTL